MREGDAERALLEARVEDMLRRVERYEVAIGPFLSPREQHYAAQKLKGAVSDACGVFYGGYDGSERNRLFVLPAYLQTEDGVYTAAVLREMLPEHTADAVRVLSVAGSGYRKLSHRDYLGSLLGLGIKRDTLGDIVVRDDCHALVFCDGAMADYILSELRLVGSDTVKVTAVTLDADFRVERRMRPISDTVASPRLDAIVSSLISTSREKAQALIKAGLVEVDYEPCERNDKMLEENAVISVRGHGKYVIGSVSEQTKKGRYRLIAAQYD
ncbi:MAG: hypothetical protein E7606_00165 [Ruminococcaceae bacterium]|nr:hypothetical protein [Oscillospiraceae bacterium]